MPSVRILCTKEVFNQLSEIHLDHTERNLQRMVARDLSTPANPHDEGDIEIIWNVVLRARNMVDMAIEVLFSRKEASDMTAEFLEKAYSFLLVALDLAIPPQIRSYSLWICPQDGAIWGMHTR